MEVVYSVLFSQLNMDFDARLENIFKQLKILRVPVERGHRCREWLRQFGNSVNIDMETCRIVVVCQLLKGQQNLICVNCRRGILTAELRLTCRVALFPLSSTCTGEALSDFFVNSCHHVVAIFWARTLCLLVVEDVRFRMRIPLGVVLIRSLVVPNEFRDVSGAVAEWP